MVREAVLWHRRSVGGLVGRGQSRRGLGRRGLGRRGLGRRGLGRRGPVGSASCGKGRLLPPFCFAVRAIGSTSRSADRLPCLRTARCGFAAWSRSVAFGRARQFRASRGTGLATNDCSVTTAGNGLGAERYPAQSGDCIAVRLRLHSVGRLDRYVPRTIGRS